jgi:hypothetical protein
MGSVHSIFAVGTRLGTHFLPAGSISAPHRSWLGRIIFCLGQLPHPELENVSVRGEMATDEAASITSSPSTRSFKSASDKVR